MIPLPALHPIIEFISAQLDFPQVVLHLPHKPKLRVFAKYDGYRMAISGVIPALPLAIWLIVFLETHKSRARLLTPIQGVKMPSRMNCSRR